MSYHEGLEAHLYNRPSRMYASKRVVKTAVVSYIARTDETIIFGEPPERPTEHKVAAWIMKKIDFVGGLIHVTWEWTVVE